MVVPGSSFCLVKHRILQTTPKVLQWKGRKRLNKGKKGTQEDGVAVRDTQENASEQERMINFVVPEKRLGIAPSPQQPEGELELHIQEEHRGEHQGLRS